MQLFPRPDFLRSIRPHCGDGLVKVLTGLRRSGKSSLLRLIAANTAQKLDLPKEDFLFLDFEDSSLRRLTRPEILHDYIAEKAKGARKRLTVFLDEVRAVESWEKVVRSLQDRGRCDLFVTTSGADPLSGESTLLAGRTVRFEVTPYSFREFRAVRKTVCADVAEETIWRDYLAWGGMPAVTNFADVSDAKLYLIDVFRSILLSDVTARRNLRDTRALETTLAFAAERCGDRISLGDFAAFLASQRQTVSRDTIADYLRRPPTRVFFSKSRGTTPIRRFAVVPSGFSPTTAFARLCRPDATNAIPNPSSKTSSSWNCAAEGGQCGSARKERRRSTSSPKRRESVFTCRSAGFWIRRKPSRARSRPFTTSRTTGPSSSFPWIRCCVPGTAFGTKTFANGSSKTTDGPRAKKRPGTIGFVPGLTAWEMFLRDQSRSSTAAKKPSVLFTWGNIWK